MKLARILIADLYKVDTTLLTPTDTAKIIQSISVLSCYGPNKFIPIEYRNVLGEALAIARAQKILSFPIRWFYRGPRVSNNCHRSTPSMTRRCDAYGFVLGCY